MRTPRIASSRLNWLPPCRFKRTRPSRRKTKSCFCACAITFQTQSVLVYFATWWTDLPIQSVAWLYPVVFHPRHFMFPFHRHSRNTVPVPAKHNQQHANNTIFESLSQHCGWFVEQWQSLGFLFSCWLIQVSGLPGAGYRNFYVPPHSNPNFDSGNARYFVDGTIMWNKKGKDCCPN